MTSRLLSVIRRHPLLAFFALAYTFSWWPWPLEVAFGWPIGFLPTGPLLAGLLVIALTQGRVGLRALGARIVRWRVGWHWYAVALGVPLTVLLVAVASNVALGAPAPSLASLGPLPGLSLVFAVRLIDPTDGPMGEEPGWRGFALPALLTGRSPLIATVRLGLLVAGWHLPLAFVGGMQPIDFLGPIAFAIVCTWLFSHTGDSVLMTIVMHAAEGTVHPSVLWLTGADATRVDWLYALAWCAAAIGVILFDWRTWRQRRPGVSPG